MQLQLQEVREVRCTDWSLPTMGRVCQRSWTLIRSQVQKIKDKWFFWMNRILSCLVPCTILSSRDAWNRKNREPLRGWRCTNTVRRHSRGNRRSLFLYILKITIILKKASLRGTLAAAAAAYTAPRAPSTIFGRQCDAGRTSAESDGRNWWSGNDRFNTRRLLLPWRYIRRSYSCRAFYARWHDQLFCACAFARDQLRRYWYAAIFASSVGYLPLHACC